MVAVARRRDLLVRDLENETVVYDLRNERAHCLNRSAAAIWRLCDGRRDLAALVDEARRTVDPGVDEALVRSALEQLSQVELLETPLDARPAEGAGRGAGAGRRRALKKLAAIGGLSLAIPMVWSIVAPTPAYAMSCTDPSACTSAPNGTCCGTVGSSAMWCQSGVCAMDTSKDKVCDFTCP